MCREYSTLAEVSAATMVGTPRRGVLARCARVLATAVVLVPALLLSLPPGGPRGGAPPRALLLAGAAGPSLSEYELDMTQGLLTLTFTQMVFPKTLNASQLTIQANNSDSSALKRLSLTGYIPQDANVNSTTFYLAMTQDVRRSGAVAARAAATARRYRRARHRPPLPVGSEAGMRARAHPAPREIALLARAPRRAARARRPPRDDRRATSHARGATTAARPRCLTRPLVRRTARAEPARARARPPARLRPRAR